jgi:protoheme IX farnesyltransferase
MLPVIFGDQVAARVVLAHAITLVLLALLPLALGAGPIYALGALGGGAYFVYRSVVLVRTPTPRNAIRNFLASLLQLGLLLLGAIVDGLIDGRLISF